MVHPSVYGSVLPPYLAIAAYDEAIDIFSRQTLLPILTSAQQASRPAGVPTSYGVAEPQFDQGIWSNAYQWDESPSDTAFRIVWGLLKGEYPDGIWVDFQLGFRGSSLARPSGPYGKQLHDMQHPGRDFYSIFTHSLLTRVFRQDKQRASGIWFSRKFQIKPNLRQADSRRIPFR